MATVSKTRVMRGVSLSIRDDTGRVMTFKVPTQRSFRVEMIPTVVERESVSIVYRATVCEGKKGGADE
jgi:hypothetical protein